MIRIREIYKDYQMGENNLHALSNVSFTINQGEFAAIVGASGSGKTTLMNIIGCLDTATSGEYFLDGKRVSSLSQNELSIIRNEKIGFVFQGFNLIPTLTAYENVELPLIYRKLHKSERDRLVKSALELVGLGARSEHKPNQLSGGQQQRVAIARAIAASPPVILADEPCGNLDSKAGNAIMDILHDLNKAGKTVVLITHDNNAASTANRIIRIKDGVVSA